MLFLAMQVRVMAACMESQIDKQEYTASAQSRARDGTGGINQPSDVCAASSPSHACTHGIYLLIIQSSDSNRPLTPLPSESNP